MARADDRLVRWLFVRALGVIYLIAFVSLWFQVRGLIGAGGILPVDRLIDAARQSVEAHQIGIDRYRLLPTLSWFAPTDAMLIAECAAGVALGALVVIGVAPGPCLALLWALYLSLATVGQDFFEFQWDSLLLEAGFLAIFFAPWRLLAGLARERAPSRLVRSLLLWLLFRLMFESGCVKLLSGDPSWRHLTALTVHYQTQPLPTWIGWYAHQLPVRMQTISCAVMFAIELGAPFLIFASRRLRLAGFGLLVGLQTLILLTGNYTFFNALAIALCLLLLDDAAVARLLPERLRRRLVRAVQTAREPALSRWRRVAPVALAVVVLPISLAEFMWPLGVQPFWLEPAAAAAAWLSPLRTINNYGLFAVMTTTRNEIIVEGSDDGVMWLSYEFKDKPGDVMRRPTFVAPHQPRLDWQMWFAALGSLRDNRWFSDFCQRLLQGAPSVLGLLATNPFPQHPPRYVRAVLYDYRFTTFAERSATGAWWARVRIGEYMPAMSLSEPPR